MQFAVVSTNLHGSHRDRFCGGDVLTIIAPSPADSTLLADVGFALAGIRRRETWHYVSLMV